MPVAQAFAMLSHPGRVRQSNEDACGALPEQGVYAVCDGMGGAAAGEVASRLALDTFLAAMGPQPAPPSTRRAPAKFPRTHPQLRLEEAVRAANHAVYRHSLKAKSLHGMGTTMVAALLEPASPILWLVHVGDSRAYLFRAGQLHLLTQDHSLVEEQIQAGLLSRVQAAGSPVRNIITRAIGSQATVEPEVAPHPTQPGDLFLLASDGLTRELEDDDIARLLGSAAKHGFTLEATCHALTEAANAAGGGDNITTLLLQIP
jgi:protein phosphatase